MRANAVMLTIIGMLLLVGIAGAAIPDTVTITSNKNWIVANGVDQSIITVEVRNTTFGPVQGATVTFGYSNSLGTLSSMGGTTDLSGTVSTIFNAKTTSGATLITATVTDGSYNNIVTLVQNIDHDILIPKFTPTTGIVGEKVQFIVTITDQWGNPIDNRRGDDTVSLSLTCPLPYNCSFVGYGYSYSNKPDLNGTLSIPVQLGTASGTNIITLNSIKDPVQNIEQQYAYIDVKAGNPADLTAIIEPPTATVPVNGGIIYFIYILSDKFGNPISGQPITISTSLAEPISIATTLANGQTPIQKYGPKVNTYTNVTITGTTIFPNIVNRFNVTFSPSNPKDMVLFVRPDTMPSLEVDPSSFGEIWIRVVDEYGFPVPGESITFSLNPDHLDEWDTDPYLDKSFEITDDNGNVQLKFTPGSFNTSVEVNGSSTLTANWISSKDSSLSVTRTAKFTWMNYPYVSIYARTNPNQTVLVNDTIDVTIDVVGRGNPKTNPISVVLDLDGSSSLNSGDRGPASKNASIRFAKNMTNKDQIGLVSFGDDTNLQYHVFHSDATSNFLEISDAITSLTMSGGVSGQNAISVNDSIFAAVNILKNHPNPEGEDVKAIITLGDSAYINEAELPGMVKEAWTDNHIRVFTVMFLSEPGGGKPCGKPVDSPGDSKYIRMEALAKQTEGQYYWGCNESQIDTIYANISATLRTLASTNTSMKVSFEQVSVNGNLTSGTAVYDYVPVEMGMTSPDSRTTILWPNNTRSFKNQSTEWPNLKFDDIGTIEIGQTWSTTFRLKVKQVGLIKVFGEGSTLSINNKSETLDLPALFINSRSNSTDEGFKSGTLIVTGLDTIPSDSTNPTFIDFIPLKWFTNYNTTSSIYSATENVYYRTGSGPWIQFDVKSGISKGDSSQSTTLDVRNFPVGTYEIMVHATAPDAVPFDALISTINVGKQGVPRLILK